jgi:3-deoxy-D-manno-octulosonic acid kinase
MLDNDTFQSSFAQFIDIVRGPYVISSRGILSDQQATVIVRAIMDGGESNQNATLGGRSTAFSCEIPDLGRVFVKHYSHGGLLRRVTGGRFLALGTERSRLEFEVLERVRALGVKAPAPYAIVKRGAVVYGTWLVMEEIRRARNLVELQYSDGEDLPKIMESLGDQLSILIRERILHVDLHPGNVLVSPEGLVYIVDFDKAKHFNGGAAALRDIYLRRWRRAVIKHRLSPVLSETMSLILRSYSER